ncbi:MAG: UvrB/UvrC motif-containing protein [Planctomycetota bacterium]|nr:UvrB/UvrC motif-containing protein [Planctomycetota bacterium]
MICQLCQKKPAAIHITDVLEMPEHGEAEYKLVHQHICQTCAKDLKLPQVSPVPKNLANIWKLLKQTRELSRQEARLKCPDCGMTLPEFRSKGRLGCPNDYEVFKQHLDPLLDRIHNATVHSGRLPGIDDAELDRMKQVDDLRHRLDAAIREEAYEHAARLRDELQALEGGSGP